MIDAMRLKLSEYLAVRRAQRSAAWLRKHWLSAWLELADAMEAERGIPSAERRMLINSAASTANTIDVYPRHRSPWRHHRNRINLGARYEPSLIAERDAIWREGFQALQRAFEAGGPSVDPRKVLSEIDQTFKRTCGAYDQERTLRDLGFIDAVE